MRSEANSVFDGKQKIVCILLVFFFALSCKAKDTSWLKNGNFYQAIILERQTPLEISSLTGQEENGRFHLDGYGNFNGYYGILAKNVEFNQNKMVLTFKNGWIFPNNLPQKKYIDNNAIPQTYLAGGKIYFGSENSCQNKIIIIYSEKMETVTVFACRRSLKNKIYYKKIFEDKFFTISTWGWYNRVFSSKNNDMAVEK